MSLPQWAEEAAKEMPASGGNFAPRLIQALSIAWAFIEVEQMGAHHVAADEVARRITELGDGK